MILRWHVQVKNIPVNDAVTTEVIKGKLEDAGLQVHSVHFETGPGTVHTAYVRLVSPQLQERDDEETPAPGRSTALSTGIASTVFQQYEKK